jgi:hypothetical protein
MSTKLLNLITASLLVLASSLATAAGNGKGATAPAAAKPSSEIFRPLLNPMESYSLDFVIAHIRGIKFERSPNEPFNNWVSTTPEGRSFAKSLEGKLPHARSAAFKEQFEKLFESTVKRLTEAAKAEEICEISPFWQMALDASGKRYEVLPIREALYGAEPGAGNMVHNGVMLNSVRPEVLGDKAVAQLLKLFGDGPMFHGLYMPAMEERGGRLVYTQTRPFLKYCFRLTDSWDQKTSHPTMSPPKVLSRPLQLVNPQTFTVLATIPTEAFK